MIYRGYNYFLLFFIYGLAFFSLGLSALQQQIPKDTNFVLLRSIRSLGLFGLLHGITEWLIMFRIAGTFPAYESELLILAVLINPLSFVFLWCFGIQLGSDESHRFRKFRRIPWLIFLLWIPLFVFSPFHSVEESSQWLLFSDTMSRYFIGLPAGITVFAALHAYLKRHGARSKAIYLRFMAWLFLIYGLLAGLVVRPHDFFPASLVNSDQFYALTGVPVEVTRTLTAVAITLLFTTAIDNFRWEWNERIASLAESQRLGSERRKMARELHDGLIQSLFAAGLQVENLLNREDAPAKKQSLSQIKDELNRSIRQVRDFIQNVSAREITADELKSQISELVTRMEKLSGIPIHLQYEIPSVTIGHISPPTLTQMYYIIQEALSNAIKHSEADRLDLSIRIQSNFVVITIRDTGKGMVLEKRSPDGHGLTAMRERADLIGGELKIHSSGKGTTVTLHVPWRNQND